MAGSTGGGGAENTLLTRISGKVGLPDSDERFMKRLAECDASLTAMLATIAAAAVLPAYILGPFIANFGTISGPQ